MSFLSSYPFTSFFDDDDLDEFGWDNFEPNRRHLVHSARRPGKGDKSRGKSLWKAGKNNFDLSPPMDVSETNDSFKVHLSVPGAERDNIHVNFDPERHELSINGEMASEHHSDNTDQGDEDKPKRIISERVSGSFQRRFTLPDNVDGDAIKANYRNGVLDVSIPKVNAKEKADLRRIEIGGDE